MKKLILFSVWFCACVCVYSQTESLSQNAIDQLKSEQVKMFEMFCNGDADGFKTIVGNDYLTINADGTYMGKDEMLEIIPKFKGANYKILEQTDRIYNNLVISTGQAKFYFGSLLVADTYFHQVWIFRNGKWEFISWQGTMTGAPKNYPVYFTLIVLLVLFGLFWVIVKIKKRRRLKRANNEAKDR